MVTFVDEGGLVLVRREPSPALRPYVTCLSAYVERHAVPLRRREPPFGGAVLIIGFGEPYELFQPHLPGSPVRLASFTGGLSDRYTDTTLTGAGEGLQVNLTPIGARLLFGVPMSELARRVLPPDDLPGRWFRETRERLAEVRDPLARLALLEETLIRRIHAGPDLGPQIPWIWNRLVATRGRAVIADLVRDIGWSHRHLVARFRDQVGLSPKAAARVLRFEHALRRLSSGRPLAEVAVECGYYDQAHMSRDFAAMAGMPPARLVTALREGRIDIPTGAIDTTERP